MSNAIQSIGPNIIDPVLGEIMESMTFAGVERMDDSEIRWDANAFVWARVDLIAPAVGDFWMLAERDAAMELTDVVWAGEIEATPEAAKALMAELVNAVAGQVLAELDNNAQVQIGLPETGEGAIRPSEFEEVRHAFILDDGTPIGVLIRAAA
jgi:hypothetical protein